jgi:alginate O-acetyltransferase complex protein AlgI
MDFVIITLISWGFFLIVAGYFLPTVGKKVAGRLIAWALVAVTSGLVMYLTYPKTPIYRMFAVVSLLLLAMKPVVMVEVYAGKTKLTFVQYFAFLAWFGMRPQVFDTLCSPSLHGAGKLALKGITRILVGLLLLFLSQKVEQTRLPIYFLSELLALVGLSFVLHFGILNLVTAFWRWLGVDVRELFRAPYKSKSLREFWGKRWNLAFSEMTAIIAYKPLKGKIGNQTALILAFLFSGLLHEIAISLPVLAGFGLPMLYFFLQSIAMQMEDKVQAVKYLLKHPVFCHLWTMCWLVIPMPLLFHTPFNTLVVNPLRDFLVGIIFW